MEVWKDDYPFQLGSKISGENSHFESQECDAILLRHGVEEFLTYDLVGAPWSWAYKKATMATAMATTGKMKMEGFIANIHLVVSFFVLVFIHIYCCCKAELFQMISLCIQFCVWM